jgi:phage terminase small subunit
MDDFEDKGAKKRKAINKANARKALRPTSSLLEEYPTLTEKQVAYVENRAGYGMTKQDAAKAAGYAASSAPSTATNLENLPAITEAMAAERARNARMSGVTRQDVIDGIKEAIDQAKLLAEPMAQIAGWREIAKMNGYYAPEIKELRLTGSQEAKMQEMKALTDEELLELAAKDDAIEGESKRLN